MAGCLPSVSLVTCSHMHTRVCCLGFSQEREVVTMRYPKNLRLIREILVNGVRMSFLLRVQRCFVAKWGFINWEYASSSGSKMVPCLMDPWTDIFPRAFYHSSSSANELPRPFNLTSPRIWTRCLPKLVGLPSSESRAAYLPDQIKSQSMHYGWKLTVWVLHVYTWFLTAEKKQDKSGG